MHVHAEVVAAVEREKQEHDLSFRYVTGSRRDKSIVGRKSSAERVDSESSIMTPRPSILKTFKGDSRV